MIRRFAHGATTRPQLSRPGSGFGRPARPGPAASLRAQTRDWSFYRRFEVPEDLLVGGRLERSGPA